MYMYMYVYVYVCILYKVQYTHDYTCISSREPVLQPDSMKGTKVQTLGERSVAGAWCMAGWLIAYYDRGCNYTHAHR